MKILTALAALTLISAPANAESVSAGIARIQAPKIQQKLGIALAAVEAGDMTTACSETRTSAMLLRWNISGFYEMDEELGKAKTRLLQATDTFLRGYCTY